MIHRIVSFYRDDLPFEIVNLQKRVFHFFDLDLKQITWNKFVLSHTGAIQLYIENTNDYDFISMFDIDCIPTTKKWKDKTLSVISDKNTIYGNAQASNVFWDINPHRTPPFANGGVFNMSYSVWDKVKRVFKYDILTNSHYREPDHAGPFCCGKYPNTYGNIAEADGYEIFNREAEKLGVRVVLSYPTYCHSEYTWCYDESQEGDDKRPDKFGYPKFSYGNGTEYDSDTFHNFQIRIPDKRIHFFKKCKEILGEKFEKDEWTDLLTKYNPKIELE